jgi:hypothetical protein
MGKYVIDGLLGPGGVTETYLAHVEDGKGGGGMFALKLLRPDRVGDGFSKVSERFLVAGRQLRDFHRPGFGRVVEVCDQPGLIFIVSEHVAGCDLGRLLETCQAEGKKGVHPMLVGLIGSEMARLLNVAHSAKPVFPHLGLCPQNVIVAESGEVTLLDAGMAASVRALTEQPPERWALVAPELQSVDVGARPLTERAALAADLYSLGALMFHLITGHAPSVPAEIPDRPGMTGKMAAALRTLLSVEPDDRPGDAAVLVEWLAGDVVQARQRQMLIAQGVHATEKGLRVSSPDLPAVVLAPNPLRVAIVPTNAPAAAKTAAPPRRGRTRLGLLLACAAAAGAGAVGSLCWSPSPPQSSARQAPPVPIHAKVEAPAAQPATAPRPKAAAPEPVTQAGILANVAGHLVVETVPPGAMLWVDGVLKGKTFADVVMGEGGHRIVVVAPGYRMFRDVVDTTNGAIIRKNLVEVAPPARGNGFLDVSCRTAGTFPVLIDDEESGVLCPATRVPTTAGKHTVGIFVPSERRTVVVETTVEAGSQPAVVAFSQ